jgi:hypothetical protein
MIHLTYQFVTNKAAMPVGVVGGGLTCPTWRPPDRQGALRRWRWTRTSRRGHSRSLPQRSTRTRLPQRHDGTQLTLTMFRVKEPRLNRNHVCLKAISTGTGSGITNPGGCQRDAHLRRLALNNPNAKALRFDSVIARRTCPTRGRRSACRLRPPAASAPTGPRA